MHQSYEEYNRHFFSIKNSNFSDFPHSSSYKLDEFCGQSITCMRKRRLVNFPRSHSHTFSFTMFFIFTSTFVPWCPDPCVAADEMRMASNDSFLSSSSLIALASLTMGKISRICSWASACSFESPAVPPVEKPFACAISLLANSQSMVSGVP